MANSGKIHVGMDFSTFNTQYDELSKNNKVVRVHSGKAETVQYFKNDYHHVGTAFKGFSGCNNDKENYIDWSYIRTDAYERGAKALTWDCSPIGERKTLNVFDYIIGNNQHAVDLNHNNKVDSDEIFSGNLDFDTYIKAKKEGDLKKYKEYKNEQN